ncbi:hypothetical protein D3C87_467460 [compost metagenome]
MLLTDDFKAIPQNPPEPDFVIQLNGKSIGIEHTQLIRLPDERGINFKAHNVIADKIMAKAETLYNKNHNNCLRISVDFKCDYGLASQNPTQLFNNDINVLSEYIANFISERLPFIIEYPHLTHFRFQAFDWDIGRIVLPEKIREISITNTANFKNSCWTTSKSVCVPDIYNSIELSTILAKKDKKPQNYKSNYSGIWLVIVEDSMNLNSYFDFEDKEQKEISTAFDRVFILRRANNIIIELNNSLAKSIL